MKMPPCPKCKGRVFLEDDEWVCFSCGCRPTGHGWTHDDDQKLIKEPRESFAMHGRANQLHQLARFGMVR